MAPPSKNPAVAYLDGLVGTTSPDKQYIVTSPNVEYIPVPAWGRIELRLRADGRFGVHDPINCPQIFSSKHAHLAAILRQPDDARDPILCMWQSPKPVDFVPVDGNSASAFGTLAPTMVQSLSVYVRRLRTDVRKYLDAHPTTEGLSVLLVSMMHSLDRLQFPTTFRDLIKQVSNVQRTWLECQAYLDWVELIPLIGKYTSKNPAPLKANRMGAFSVHHDVVQNLLALGIPVWLVRRSEQVPADAVIKKMIPAIHQTSIEMGLGPFPTQAIYSGYAGTDEHFSAIWRSAYRMLDIEHILIDDAFVEKEKMITAFPEHATIAMATSCTPSTSSTPAPGVIRSTHSHTKSHPYDRQPSTKNKVTKAPNIRGMNKFVVSANTRTPRPVNVWAIALANVDRAKATANTWGYWVPEPHILVGSEGILRVQNYLRNWFWVREAWYYMLAHRALRFDPLPSKLWRDWLQNDADKVKEYTKDSKCAKRKAYVMNLFKQHFPDVVSQPPAKDTLLWYNQRYSSPPPDSIIRQIAWEVLEIAFRVELLELDRYLVPANSRYDGSGMELFRQERIAKAFPDGQFMRPVQLPTRDRGLAAAHIEDRRRSLSALYDVVRRWPDVPPEIGGCGRVCDMDDAALERFEAALAKFYVQTFYEVSGRAATIPYHFPLSSAPSSS